MNCKLRLLMFKTLSRNDTGETKSHQSGISIPKIVAKTDIFPPLGIETLNPRTTVEFYDEDGELYKFEYIYYNDQFHGKEASKSHNEFRLTRVIDFLRKVNAHSGDQIWFGLDDQGGRRIGLVKKTDDTDNTQDAQVNKIKQPIRPINQAVEEEIDLDEDDIPILDQDSMATPQVVVLNRGWVKVELK